MVVSEFIELRAPNMRPIDDRGYQYDKKWVINDK
jgi:hypothetical protein